MQQNAVFAPESMEISVGNDVEWNVIVITWLIIHFPS